MNDQALIHTIVGLRIVVAVAWGWIGAIGSLSIWRIVCRRPAKGDAGWGSLGLIGAGLLIFQWRALGGYTQANPDKFTAIALFSFVLSAAGIFHTRAMKAPEEHQQAAVISHFGVLAMLMIAGLLSSS